MTRLNARKESEEASDRETDRCPRIPSRGAVRKI